MPLKSRASFPPGGWQFYEPATGWYAPLPGVDNFNVTVDKIIAHRRANPRFNLPTDWDTVANTLDTFTCHRIGFNVTYCETADDGLKKKSQSDRQQQGMARGAGQPQQPGIKERLAKLALGIRRSAVGSRILTDWLGAGGMPVPIEQANKRANTCVTCPLNNMESDWFFGIPKAVAVAIHEQRKVKLQMDLKVDQEDKLGTCDACGCELSLKAWVPIRHILAQTPKNEFDKLHPKCWIRSEK